MSEEKIGVELLNNEHGNNENRLKRRMVALAQEEQIPEDLHADFVKHMEDAIHKFKCGEIAKDLPKKPLRGFEHGENVIDYIRAEDGLGPWVAANALNRPLILRLAPGAYYALNTYLRRHELPDDLNIPTKSEVLAQEEITPESIKAARRLLSRVQREKQRSGPDMS